MNQLQIGFLIYPGVIQLDVMGAYQVLAFPFNTQVHLLWKTLSPVVSNEGLILTPTKTLTECPPLDTPEPPFDAGTPETAGEEVVRSLMQLGKPLLDAFQTQTQKVAAELNVENKLGR